MENLEKLTKELAKATHPHHMIVHRISIFHQINI
jgi:hypothetical protein